MEIILNSREYECWHEAGHAAICLIHDGTVELMEIVSDERAAGRARARCEAKDNTRPLIACGGFAAEYHLYKSGVVNVSEKEFVQVALFNASADKLKFFGSDQVREDGYWPLELDMLFRDFAIYKVAPLIAQYFELVKELANTFFESGYVSESEINKIKEKHIKCEVKKANSKLFTLFRLICSFMGRRKKRGAN